MLDLVDDERLTLQGKSDGELASGPRNGLLTCATDRLRRVLTLPRAGSTEDSTRAAAAELSNRWNAAWSGARAAEDPHPGVLPLRDIPGHCDQRLTHEHDIGRRA